MAWTSSVSIDGCEITVTHRLHFFNYNCDDETFRSAVDEMKEGIRRVWGGEFRYGFCTVRFVFDFVEELPDDYDDIDVKVIRCADGVSHQRGLGPERTVGVWYIGDEDWHGGVAAHEVSHELGLADHYECTDAAGNVVDCYILDATGTLIKNPAAGPPRPKDGYPRDGIAFTTRGRPKDRDIVEIMRALGVECPCPELEFDEPGEDPGDASGGGTTGTTGGTTTDGGGPDAGSGDGTGDGDSGSTPDGDGRGRNDCLLEFRLAAYGMSRVTDGFVILSYEVEVEGHKLTGQLTRPLEDDGVLDIRPWQDLDGPLVVPGWCDRFHIGFVRLRVELFDRNFNRLDTKRLWGTFEGVCPTTTTLNLGAARKAGLYRFDFGFRILEHCSGAVVSGSDTSVSSGEDDPTPSTGPDRRAPRTSVLWDGDEYRPDADDGTTTPPPTTYGEELEGENERPLVFVPGFMGSTLAVRRPDGSLHTIWPPGLGNLPRDLVEGLDPDRRADIVPTGLFPEVYDGLIAFILRPRRQGGLGHIASRTFWIMPYDWRLPNSDNGRRLKDFIQEKLRRVNAARRAAGKPPFDAMDVINHSNGGIITRSAILEHHAAVHKTVYLASPHFGAPEAHFSAHPGIDKWSFDAGSLWTNLKLSAWWYVFRRRLRDPRTFSQAVKKLAVKFWCSYDLMPDEFYLSRRHYTVLRVPENRYGGGVDGTYLQHPWQFPRRYHPQVNRAMTFKAGLGSSLPGEHLFFYSGNKSQYDIVEWGVRRGLLRRKGFGGFRRSQQLNGDGTAPDWSAGLRFEDTAHAVQVLGGHNEIPNIPDVHSHIRRFLDGR